MNEYDRCESHRYAGNLGHLYLQTTWMQTQARQLATMAAIRFLARALFRMVKAVARIVSRRFGLLDTGAGIKWARSGGTTGSHGRSMR